MSHDTMDRTEEMLGRVLTVGSRTSTAILAAGLALAVFLPTAPAASWLLAIGLIALILTPIARVAVSVIAFARAHEWLFALCTSFVLVLLIISFIVAFAA